MSDASQKTNVNSVLFPGVGYAAGGNLAKMDEIHALERMLNRQVEHKERIRKTKEAAKEY